MDIGRLSNKMGNSFTQPCYGDILGGMRDITNLNLGVSEKIQYISPGCNLGVFNLRGTGFHSHGIHIDVDLTDMRDIS